LAVSRFCGNERQDGSEMDIWEILLTPVTLFFDLSNRMSYLYLLSALVIAIHCLHGGKDA
jgi:hypothetical protein